MQPSSRQEYGVQDFVGAVNEMRLWRTVRTPEQIRDGMRVDEARAAGYHQDTRKDIRNPDLVAYWR